MIDCYDSKGCDAICEKCMLIENIDISDVSMQLSEALLAHDDTVYETEDEEKRKDLTMDFFFKTIEKHIQSFVASYHAKQRAECSNKEAISGDIGCSNCLYGAHDNQCDDCISSTRIHKNWQPV